jgi:hypothetical protein
MPMLNGSGRNPSCHHLRRTDVPRIEMTEIWIQRRRRPRDPGAHDNARQKYNREGKQVRSGVTAFVVLPSGSHPRRVNALAEGDPQVSVAIVLERSFELPSIAQVSQRFHVTCREQQLLTYLCEGRATRKLPSE